MQLASSSYEKCKEWILYMKWQDKNEMKCDEKNIICVYVNELDQQKTDILSQNLTDCQLKYISNL